MNRMIWLLLLLLCNICLAQNQILLNDLSDFKPQAGNWQIVGDVTMNRNASPAEHAPVEKKSKKNKVETVPAYQSSAGTGILLNVNTDDKKDALITNWEHGDIELEFDVMLPKGSNSGVYLQGRYEIQLLDSWGVKFPQFSDIGGIYRNWETEPDKALQGIPPLLNASRAVGLWQHFKIRFKAPRFDEKGNKIKNALFESVELNGVTIHQFVEVAHATGGPIDKKEATKGPLMIQGDHGAVAFKNFKYTLLSESQVTISNITYQAFEGAFRSIDELKDIKPTHSDQINMLDIGAIKMDDVYGAIFNGNINIPTDDRYTFTVGFTGGFRLLINNQLVSEQKSSDGSSEISGNIELKKGIYPFQIINIKNAGWHAPKIGLFVETSSTTRKSLHAYSSFPETEGLVSPILINPTNQTRLLRAFVPYKGGSPKLSHTIGVGHPDRINYVYNLENGGLVAMWRGDFVDATPMWHDRGDGSFRPNGSVIWTFLDQPLAKLKDATAAFPAFESSDLPKQEGYSIDPNDGLPIFKQTYQDVFVETTIKPDTEVNYLIQNLKFSQGQLSNWYLKLADGPLTKMSDGSYAVDGQKYYINMLTSQVPFEREINGKKELVLPIDGSEVTYEIIW